MIIIAIILAYMITGATCGYLYNDYRVKAEWGYKPQADYTLCMALGMFLAPAFLTLICALMIAGKFKIILNKSENENSIKEPA